MGVMGIIWLFVLEGVGVVGGGGGGLVWLTPDSYLEHFFISLHPAIIVPPESNTHATKLGVVVYRDHPVQALSRRYLLNH